MKCYDKEKCSLRGMMRQVSFDALPDAATEEQGRWDKLLEAGIAAGDELGHTDHDLHFINW